MKYKIYKVNTLRGRTRAYNDGFENIITCLSNLGMRVNTIRICLDNNGNYSEIKIK